jgi:hypothetical protein
MPWHKYQEFNATTLYVTHFSRSRMLFLISNRLKNYFFKICCYLNKRIEEIFFHHLNKKIFQIELKKYRRWIINKSHFDQHKILKLIRK